VNAFIYVCAIENAESLAARMGNGSRASKESDVLVFTPSVNGHISR
jgi:hypothetical protein